MRINILTVNNGVGLERDALILAERLKNHTVKITDMAKSKIIAGKWDIFVHCEIVWPHAFPKGTINYLIPNQEWFKKEWLPLLHKFDGILCKTRHAFTIFSQLHDHVRYISFTSKDMWQKSGKKGIIHNAGKSESKGTKSIMESWKPEYPVLLITQDRIRLNNTKPNIDYRYGRINEDNYKALLNTHALHICTSEAEGWGHYIWEAMSTGAAVITLDAPPMDEYTDCLKVGYRESKPMGLGNKYAIDPVSFQNTLEKALSLDLSEIGQRNRERYEDNHDYFCNAIKEIF